MAPRPPLASLRQARITFGGAPLFEDVTLAVAAGERACLVGRNGCGKSTLLRVLAGEVDLDGGERFVAPGVRVVYLPQDPDLPRGVTVGPKTIPADAKTFALEIKAAADAAASPIRRIVQLRPKTKLGNQTLELPTLRFALKVTRK